MNLLKELERLTRKLDPDVREAFLDEVRDHLEADIRARMELGLSQEMAEHDAVAAFGDPVRMVRKLSAVHRPPLFDRPFLTSVVSFFAVFALTLLADWCELLPMQITGSLTFAMLVLGLPAIAVTAWRARVFQWRTLLMLYPIVSLWFAMVGAAAYAPDTDGVGIGTPYAKSREWADEAMAEADRYDRSAREFEAYYARFAAGENLMLVKRPGSGFEMKTAPDRATAIEAWKKIDPRRPFRKSAEMNRDAAMRLHNISRWDWWKGIPVYLKLTQVISGGWIAIIAALSLAVSLLRLTVDRLRRKSPLQS